MIDLVYFSLTGRLRSICIPHASAARRRVIALGSGENIIMGSWTGDDAFLGSSSTVPVIIRRGFAHMITCGRHWESWGKCVDGIVRRRPAAHAWGFLAEGSEIAGGSSQAAGRWNSRDNIRAICASFKFYDDHGK